MHAACGWPKDMDPLPVQLTLLASQHIPSVPFFLCHPFSNVINECLNAHSFSMGTRFGFSEPGFQFLRASELTAKGCHRVVSGKV